MQQTNDNNLCLQSQRHNCDSPFRYGHVSPFGTFDICFGIDSSISYFGLCQTSTVLEATDLRKRRKKHCQRRYLYHFYSIRYPPLADIVWPEIHLDSSEARKPTTWAISSALPWRCSTGVVLSCSSTISFGTLSIMSLSVGPGSTALTVVPLPPSSAANPLVNPSSAAF